MKPIFFVWIFIFFTFIVFAEELPLSEAETAETVIVPETSTSMIGFSFGYILAGFRETTIADVNRYLNTVVFSFHSVIDKDPYIHTQNMVFFTGENEMLVKYHIYEFENEYQDYYKVRDTYTKLFMEYAMARKLWGPPKTFPGYLGGAMRGDLYLVQTLENPMYINFTAIVSLDLYASQKWIINDKNSLVMSLSVPLLGYALRPNYIGISAWPFETGFVSVHNYNACTGSLKYYYRLNGFVSLYSDIGFEASQIKLLKTRKDASFQVKLGAVYNY